MSLLTPLTEQYIKKGFKMGQLFGSHPYAWNDSEDRAELTKSKFQYCAWVLTALVSVGYFGFVATQWYRLTSGPDGKFDPFLSFALVYFAAPIFLHLNFLMAMGDLPGFVNKYLGYGRTFHDRYVDPEAPSQKMAKLAELNVVGAFFGLWLNGAAVAIITFIRSDAPEQISSTLVTEMWHPLRLVLFALFVYYLTGMIANGCLMAFTGCAFGFTVFPILAEFGKSPSEFTVPELQQPHQLVRVYRVLHMLVRRNDSAYRVIIGAANYILILLAILCTYGGIRLPGLTGVTFGILGVTANLLLAMALAHWSKLHFDSENVLGQLSSRLCTCGRGRCQYMDVVRRELKTLKPLQLTIFRMYIVDKPLTLTVLQAVIDQVVSLLVAY